MAPATVLAMIINNNVIAARYHHIKPISMIGKLIHRIEGVEITTPTPLGTTWITLIRMRGANLQRISSPPDPLYPLSGTCGVAARGNAR